MYNNNSTAVCSTDDGVNGSIIIVVVITHM